MHDFVAEGVFDGGIVALDKVALAVLHRQGRFAWFTSTCQVARPCRVHDTCVGQRVPTEREPRMAIFRCLTDGAILDTADDSQP